MLNYLYYKLYQASLKSSLYDIPEFFTAVLLGCLIASNLMMVNALFSKLGFLIFLFNNNYQITFFYIFLMGMIYYYFNKFRIQGILEKYSLESNTARVKGNILVAFYVALSYVAIFAVAFYKPGKL